LLSAKSGWTFFYADNGKSASSFTLTPGGVWVTEQYRGLGRIRTRTRVRPVSEMSVGVDGKDLDEIASQMARKILSYGGG
jgi:hypothetical protein